jgi:hypothetical protein
MSEYAQGWTLPSDLDQRRHLGLGSWHVVSDEWDESRL